MRSTLIRDRRPAPGSPRSQKPDPYVLVLITLCNLPGLSGPFGYER